MTVLEMDSEGVNNLRAEEERILASFTRHLIEIAAVPIPGIGHLPDRGTQCDAPARDRT